MLSLELEIGKSNYTTTTYQSTIDNGGTTINVSTFQAKTNLSGGNNAINVMGNIYRQKTYYYQGNDQLYLYDRQPQHTWEPAGYTRLRTEMGYMLRITPYNINVETTITLNVQIDMQYIYGNDMQAIALYRKVFNSTENSWNSYINMQLAQGQAYDIADEITNINNGFYYTEQDKNTWLDTSATDNAEYHETYTDQVEITIVPNVNNYYYIEYIPYCYDTYGDTPFSVAKGSGINDGTLKINGTNIISTGDYEVIDIPGMMFSIIGMPFAFVSQAFNLTLFPGTPYQINIANLFLSIIAIFVFVWIIGIFIKHKG